jgi:exodeoxyribonuclease VII small subunit
MPKIKADQTIDYAEANLALEEVLAKLQQPGLQVDEAVKLYEEGLGLIQKLEAYLATAENKIERIRLAAEKAESEQNAA